MAILDLTPKCNIVPVLCNTCVVDSIGRFCSCTLHKAGMDECKKILPLHIRCTEKEAYLNLLSCGRKVGTLTFFRLILHFAVFLLKEQCILQVAYKGQRLVDETGTTNSVTIDIEGT